jgi:hypothetical protein
MLEYLPAGEFSPMDEIVPALKRDRARLAIVTSLAAII